MPCCTKASNYKYCTGEWKMKFQVVESDYKILKTIFILSIILSVISIPTITTIESIFGKVILLILVSCTITTNYVLSLAIKRY